MKKLKEILFTLITLTWGLPLVLVGVFYLIYVVLARKIIKVRYVNGRYAITLDNDIGGASFGLFYFVGSHDMFKIHYHEMGHTVQNLYWGPLILPVIAIPSIIRAAYWDKIIQKEFYEQKKPWPDYDRIWFEGQATRLGYKHFVEKESDYHKHFEIK